MTTAVTISMMSPPTMTRPTAADANVSASRQNIVRFRARNHVMNAQLSTPASHKTWK